MDNVEKVLHEVENDEEIMNVKFTGLLDETANMVERHGFGVARVFLLEKQGRADLKQQAEALLKVLQKLEQYPDVSSDKKTARLIIKAISSLQQRRRRRRQ